MTDDQPYPDGRAVEHAIKQAASTKPARVKSRALQVATRDRFLCRVFTAAGDRWALKGGTGMLARIPQARNTRDIDLLSREASIENAVEELARLAGVDLGDHFYFTQAGTKEISTGEEQPYVEGYASSSPFGSARSITRTSPSTSSSGESRVRQC